MASLFDPLGERLVIPTTYLGTLLHRLPCAVGQTRCAPATGKHREQGGRPRFARTARRTRLSACDSTGAGAQSRLAPERSAAVGSFIAVWGAPSVSAASRRSGSRSFCAGVRRQIGVRSVGPDGDRQTVWSAGQMADRLTI
eukprot:scaffold95059_cov34-Tisochrysis_lutea.AAC.5